MKKLFLAIVMLLTLSVFASNAQTPYSVSLHGGYSWLSGVVGADIQYGNFELSGGWMPSKMPMSGQPINNFCFAITANTLKAGQDGYGFYVSLAEASQGYLYEDSWGYSYTSPITIVGGGIRYNSGPVWSKVGVGYGWCDEAAVWTFEATLGFVIFGN